MLCDWCHKNEATIHIQEIVGGEKKTVHICGQCASEKAQTQDFPLPGPFNLAEMLYNLAAKNPAIAAHTAHAVPNPLDGDGAEGGLPEDPALSCCPLCHWSVDDLRRKGRLGCPECYNHFRSIIAGVLPNMHRGHLHVGKRPGETASAHSADLARIRLELMNLQHELEEVILREEFERAAVLRDRIAALRQQLSGEEVAHD